MTVYRISRKQQFDIAQLLQANGTVESGMYLYNADWDDDRIVRECISDYKGNGKEVVSGLRRELFGNLRQLRPAADLEHKLRALCKLLDVSFDALGEEL